MNVWAIAPVQSFARGKSRLSHLRPGQRAAFARQLFDHVIGQLRACPRLDGVLVATDCPDVERRALDAGARVLRDADQAVLGGVVDAALHHVAGLGADAAIVVMSDLPRLDARDIDAMIDALGTADAVIAPDRFDEGTNALALTPPDRMPTCFGRHGSFEEHLGTARRFGLRTRIHRSPRLVFDVDHPADYHRLHQSA